MKDTYLSILIKRGESTFEVKHLRKVTFEKENNMDYVIFITSSMVKIVLYNL